VNAETTSSPSRALAGVRVFEFRRVAPAALALALVLPSLVWVFLDRSIWPWDPSWYGEVSVDLWATLRTDVANWGSAMAHALGAASAGKPPAVVWLGQFFVPLGGFVGGDATALLLSIVLTQAAIIGLVFAACRRIGLSDLAAGLGALLVAASPLFVSMGHAYFAEPIQTLAVAWALFGVASATRWPVALTFVQIPGIIAFAMLAKLSSPPYVAAPLLAMVFLALVGPSEGRRAAPPFWKDWRVIASAVLSVVLVYGAISWYVINHVAALEHARLAAQNTGLFGTSQGFVEELHSWLDRLRDASFLPHIGLVLLALSIAALVLLIRRRGVKPTLDPRFVMAAACVITVAVVVVLFATQPNSDVRFILAVVPCVAIAVAIVIDASGSRNLVVAAAVVAAVEFGFVQLQSFGKKPVSSMSYPALVAPVSNTAFAKELNDVVGATCNTETAGKINMVGAEYPWFNHNNLEMLAFERYRLNGLRCYYTALGYASTDPEAGWARVKQFASPYYISIDYGDASNPLPKEEQSLIVPADPFNVINTAVFKRVVASRIYHLVPGSREDGLVLLKRAGKAGG
jgi:hypothetical protein